MLEMQMDGGENSRLWSYDMQMWLSVFLQVWK